MIDDATTHLAQACERIVAAGHAGDLTTPVAQLGRWRVRDVIQHLGGVHRWATRIVRTASMDGPGFIKSKLDGPALIDWFTEGAHDLVVALCDTPPSTACPNFNPGSPGTAAFWHRRQLLETTIHRWDVEHALGLDCTIDPAVADDGIDEYLDVFVRTRGKQTLTAPLALRTPTSGWTLRPAARPGRLDITGGCAPDAAAEIAGAPDELLLVLWNRVALADTSLTITGDHAVASSLRPT